MPSTRPSSNCLTRGCRLSCHGEGAHAILFRTCVVLMMTSLLFLAVGLVLGVCAGWLIARSGDARLRADIEKERAVHAERLQIYQGAEDRFRDAFQALSAEALKSNNEAFLQLAETRLRETRVPTTADIDA